jgi:hypothetical protein
LFHGEHCFDDTKLYYSVLAFVQANLPLSGTCELRLTHHVSFTPNTAAPKSLYHPPARFR